MRLNSAIASMAVCMSHSRVKARQFISIDHLLTLLSTCLHKATRTPKHILQDRIGLPRNASFWRWQKGTITLL